MPTRNYVSDSVPIDDSIEWIISEVEKNYPNLERGTIQLGLPGMEDFLEHFSGPRFFIIANGIIIDTDKRNIFSSTLEKGIEEIEKNFTDALVVCFRDRDYEKFSSIMKKKAYDGSGITRGWGTKEYMNEGTDYSVYVFGRNPTRTPFKY